MNPDPNYTEDIAVVTRLEKLQGFNNSSNINFLEFGRGGYSMFVEANLLFAIWRTFIQTRNVPQPPELVAAQTMGTVYTYGGSEYIVNQRHENIYFTSMATWLQRLRACFPEVRNQ